VSIAAIAAERLSAIRARGNYRRMRLLQGAQAARMQVEGRDVLLFAGSNYLDLAHHHEVVEAAAEAARRWGCAAGGSRLISGNLEVHEGLETELAEFLGREAALVFSTGYMANLGVITALVGPGDLVVSDSLNHASIVDGCRLSRADVRIFPHGDVEACAHLLRQEAPCRRRVLLAVEGIYSMDGDLAPLPELVETARRWGALVLLDDAHGTGTLGRRGRGTAEKLGVESGIDILTGTLGKALGSFGAFVAGSRALRDLLVNVSRSFIFSCALAPPQVAAARAALGLVRREPWRRARLQTHGEHLRELLQRHGLCTGQSVSHIVPILIGDNERTMGLCERLLERGFYAQGIRPPSVPEGKARLRITPMATHRKEEIVALADALAEEWSRLA
jgi:8-amino-7-oxononanoate synthase